MVLGMWSWSPPPPSPAPSPASSPGSCSASSVSSTSSGGNSGKKGGVAGAGPGAGWRWGSRAGRKVESCLAGAGAWLVISRLRVENADTVAGDSWPASPAPVTQPSFFSSSIFSKSS